MPHVSDWAMHAKENFPKYVQLKICASVSAKENFQMCQMLKATFILDLV